MSVYEQLAFCNAAERLEPLCVRPHRFGMNAIARSSSQRERQVADLQPLLRVELLGEVRENDATSRNRLKSGNFPGRLDVCDCGSWSLMYRHRTAEERWWRVRSAPLPRAATNRSGIGDESAWGETKPADEHMQNHDSISPEPECRTVASVGGAAGGAVRLDNRTHAGCKAAVAGRQPSPEWPDRSSSSAHETSGPKR